jgi:hypothetical protein
MLRDRIYMLEDLRKELADKFKTYLSKNLTNIILKFIFIDKIRINVHGVPHILERRGGNYYFNNVKIEFKQLSELEGDDLEQYKLNEKELGKEQALILASVYLFWERDEFPELEGEMRYQYILDHILQDLIEGTLETEEIKELTGYREETYVDTSM